MIRNRPPNDLAEVFADLSLEDQVVVFRLLPRKDAAATFEYLSHDEQTRLLRAMAQEDVAALLNEMAPDDRTMFLEELPATVTRQLLALLTPQERAVASTLLGYPEGSLGRLMTPNYVSVEGGLDGSGRARLHPRARAGQRNAQHDLRRGRAGAARRRHPDPRVPADLADQHRAGADGPALRRAEGDRRPGLGRRGVQGARPIGAAGDRHGGHAHRHRDHRRRAGRRRSGGDEGNPAHRRFGSSRRAIHGRSPSCAWCRSGRAG